MSVLPLLSWYHTSFDTEPDVTQIKLLPPRRLSVTTARRAGPSRCAMATRAWRNSLTRCATSYPVSAQSEEAAGRDGVTPLLSYSDARANGASVISFPTLCRRSN